MASTVSLPGSGLAAGALQRSLALAIQTATFPWVLWLRALSLWAGFVLSVISLLGAKPAGFVPQAQLRELTAVVEHMHLREDLYRKHIAELQEELDTRDSDRKKVLRKLKKTKAELSELSEQITDLQQHHELRQLGGGGPGADAGADAAGPGAGGGGRRGSRLGLHLSMALLLASVWGFYQSDQPAVQRKLLFAVLFPLCWVYVLTLLSRRPPYPLALLYCAAWAVIGFVSAHKLAQYGYS